MHVCIAFLSIFSLLDSSSLLSDGDFDVVSKLSSAALARADIKAFAKSKHNAMFLLLSIRLQHVFLTSILHLNTMANTEILYLKNVGTLGVPGLISFMAYLYTHRGAKGVKNSKKYSTNKSVELM